MFKLTCGGIAEDVEVEDGVKPGVERELEVAVWRQCAPNLKSSSTPFHFNAVAAGAIDSVIV